MGAERERENEVALWFNKYNFVSSDKLFQASLVRKKSCCQESFDMGRRELD